MLKKVENGYCYCRNKGEDYFFNEHGLLTLKTDQNGFRETYSYNKQNQLEKVAIENGSYLQYTYNKENNIIRVCDHTGREIRLWYRYGKLWKFINSMGNVYIYEYNENLKLESVITPRGTKGLLNEYDGVNRVVKQTLADGSVTEFRYDDTNFRTYMREQNGNMIIYESDERLRNIKTIYEDGEEVFEYNDNNQKTLYIDKNGNKTRYKYNEKGNLTGIENSLQHKTALTYDEHNHIIRYQYPDGSCITNEYDQEGNRVKTIDPCGNSTILGYNNHNQPESILQPDGGKILLGYDELGNIISILDAMGNKTVYAYDSLNRVVQVTDGNGNTKKYEYNNRNKIVKVINALGFEKTYDYSPSGKVTEVKNFDGSIQKMWYNLSNRPERYENREGSSVAYEYDKMGNLVCEVMPNGGRRNLSYDKFNRLLQYEDVAGGKTMFAYDACGNCIKTINARGGVTHFSYDAINRVTKVIDPDMRETKYEYDLRGNVASITDQVGNRVNIEYDACGRKTKEKVGEETVTVYSYNAIGKLKQITDGAGRETLYRYYPGGLLQAVEYSNGKTERYVYDSNRNVVEKWHNDEYGLFYSYDEENRIRTIRSSEGQVVSYDYDSVGNITCATDANGNKNKYDYSLVGRLTSVEDAKGNLTRYQYDAEGNLTCIFRTGTVEERHMDLEDAIRLNESQHNLHLTVYERNLSGQIIAVTNPLGDQETFDYDVSGKLIAKTDRDGYKTSFTYSPSGRMERVTYDDGRRAEYEYNEFSQLKQVNDWLGTITAEYNQLGRVERVTDHRGKSVSYEFGSRGERKAIIYPDGSRIEYDYDDQLRLERVRNNKKTIKYQYGKYGRMEERSCSNGLNTSYRYDYAGRLTELVHKEYDEVLEDYRYTFDKMDNKSGIKKYRKGLPEESGDYQYQYDELGNLSIVEKDGKQVRRYDYDTFSNRIVKMNGQEITKYQFNAADQMIMETGSDVCRYNYDKRGNLNRIDREGIVEKKYHFDATGRMGAAETLSGAGRQYIYNGLGKRVAILEQQDGVCSGQMEYILDMTLEYNNLLASENGMKTQKYLWGNQLEGMEENGQDSIALLDEMGSPVRFLWGNGNDMCYYGYDEFGCDLYGNAGQKQPFGYTGYLPDSISGSYFAQAREYMPEGGRFCGEDIQAGYLKSSLTLNKYLYCWNDPLKFVDLNGLYPISIELLLDIPEKLNQLKNDILDSVNEFIQGTKEELGKLAGTFTIGSNFSATPGIFQFDGNYGLAFDTKGNIGLQVSGNGGVTVGTESISASRFLSMSTAPDIYKLEGMGASAGGSAIVPFFGVPINLGGEFNIIGDVNTKDDKYYGITLLLGAGVPFGGEGHVEWGKTYTVVSFNIFDVWDIIYDYKKYTYEIEREKIDRCIDLL